MKKGKEPAFPGEPIAFMDPATQIKKEVFIGLTKREYFAGLAMQGLLSGGMNIYEIEVSNMAVKNADLLLERLEK
jgi:hypothetical protein